MKTLKIFRYLDQLDGFVVTDEYRRIADELGLTEWSPVVWIGRLFTLDNDYGEHWFDNWDLRDEKEAQAEALGVAYEEMLIIDPRRLQNGRDGPCHSDEIRKRFWTDILRSLELSYDLLFDQARARKREMRDLLHEEHIEDLEERIAGIAATM